MKKKLFTQINNEWRTNVWVIVELLVVSVVLWFVVDFFYADFSARNLPRGFDTDHCYLLQVPEINIKSPDYIPDRTDDEMIADKLELMERLRRRPEIEAVSWSHNSYPYNGSNGGITVTHIADGDTMQTDGYTLRRPVTPDFVRVFRYMGANGESPEQLAEMLHEGKILSGNTLFKDRYGVELTDYINQEFILNNDSSNIKRLGAALIPVRYSDYHTWDACVVYEMSRSELLRAGELCIRVKPEMDRDIIETLMAEAPKQFRIGNLMVSDVRSFKDIRRVYQQSDYNKERNYIFGMGFLLLNIFLGLLGTFWLRTQERLGEIAIRKVNGATDRSIFRRFVGEGLLLLTLATIPAAMIDVTLSWYEYNSWFFGYLSWERTSICILTTYGMMAFMITLGIMLPAYRAMHVRPAIALKDE